MTVDAATRGIWHATAQPRHHEPLVGDTTADVVVVGAGITGLSTSILLANRGIDVALVEALHVASGVTGRTTAKVTSQHSLLYSHIARAHGNGAAMIYGEANEAGLAQVAQFVEAGAIECAFERRPAFTYTVADDYIERVEHEADLCGRLGLPASLVRSAADDLPFEFLAAVRFDNQAQLHPVAYCDGLAQMLQRAGGRIYEQTRVTAVNDGSPISVTTDRGTITADAVVLATHIPLLDRGAFFAKVEPTASHAVALEVASGAPEGMYITAETPSRSVRSFVHAGRSYLIVVGEGHRTGEEDPSDHEQRLIRWALQHWPGSYVRNTWMAEDYSPQDGLPYVGRIARTSGDIYMATGFQKWGLTNGTAAALLLSELVTGNDHPWASVFDAKRLTPVASAKSFVRHNAKAAQHLLLDDANASADEARHLAPGEGVIINDGLKRLAVARDEQGIVHTVSAACTHMGCTVAFNAAEQTWDCPCHGSRFAVDGSVIHGPAVTALSGEDLPVV